MFVKLPLSLYAQMSFSGVDKLCFIHTVEQYTARKRSEGLICASI